MNKSLKLEYGVFFLASMWSFFWVFFGLDYTDTFYFMNKSVYSDQTDALIPLTIGLIKCTTQLFGNKVIVVRCLNWLIIYISYVTLHLTLVNGGMRLKNGILFLSAAIALLPIAQNNVFNGNSLTVMFLLYTFAMIYIYSKKGNKYYLIFTSVTICLAILSRFPNIIIVPIMMFMGLMFCNDIKDYVTLVCTLLVSVMMYIAVEMVLFGGFGEFVDSIQNSLTSSANSEGANHSVQVLLREYLHTLKDMVSNIKYLALIFTIPLVALLFCRSKTSHIIIAAVFIIANAAFVCIRIPLDTLQDCLGYHLIIYFYACLCVTMFISFAIALYNHNIKAIAWSIMPLLFSLCSPAGSDTGLSLLGGQLYAYTPFIIYTFYETIKESDTNKIIHACISLVCLSVVAFFYCRTNLTIYGLLAFVILCATIWFANKLDVNLNLIRKKSQYQSYKYSTETLIFACIIMTVFFKINAPMLDDKTIKHLTSYYDFEELVHIKTCEENVEFVNKVMVDFYKLKLKYNNIKFYGQYSDLLSFVSGTGMINNVDFRMDCSKSNLESIKETIPTNNVIFLVPYSPISKMLDFDDYLPLDSLLLCSGYKKVNRIDYMIYEKID